MGDNLNDVLKKVSAVVSQTTDVTDTSDEYTLWRNFVNMAQKEWAETYDWQILYREYNTMTSVASANATITLPSNFRKLSGYPRIATSENKEYTQIDPQKKSQYTATDNYCYLLATNNGYSLIINPATLASGTSIFISYWSSPASLVSPLDKVDCPNSDYLVQRTIAYIWEAREDNRFQQAKAEADKILGRLLENENTLGYAYNTQIQTPEQSRYGFRIGKN